MAGLHQGFGIEGACSLVGPGFAFQIADQAGDAVGQLFRTQTLAQALDHEGQREGRGMVQVHQAQGQGAGPGQGLLQAIGIEFLAQDFGLGLAEQQVVRVVLACSWRLLLCAPG